MYALIQQGYLPIGIFSKHQQALETIPIERIGLTQMALFFELLGVIKTKKYL